MILLRKLALLWPPYRKAQERQAEWDRLMAQRSIALNELLNAGWHDWLGRGYAPYQQEWVEIVRLQDYADHAYKPSIVSPRDLPPWFNVADLWWRPICGPVMEYSVEREADHLRQLS